jgi:hypothetical protein
MYQVSKFELEKDIHRHWCPYSEPFTGGDALQSALDQNWVIIGSIRVEDFALRGSRKVSVYYVRLQNEEHFRVMRIIHNPYVERLFEKLGSTVQRSWALEMIAVQA